MKLTIVKGMSVAGRVTHITKTTYPRLEIDHDGSFSVMMVYTGINSKEHAERLKNLINDVMNE